MHLQSLSKLDECDFEAPEVANISVLVQRSNEYFQQERSFFEQVSSKGAWNVAGDTPRVSEGHNLSILNITIPSVESLPQRPQLYGANSNRSKRKSILDKVPAHQQILFTKCQATELPHTLLAQVAFKEIRLLDLSHNKLRAIPRELLLQLKSLEVLKISSNFIKQLPAELFARGKCLKYLAAANNLLTRLPDLAPEDCDVLEDDDDNNCNIENFKLTQRQTSFENNSNNSKSYSAKYCNIEYLDLSINKLQEISPLFALALPRLHQLHLNTNDFDFLPTSLHNLQRLEEFSLDWYQYVIPPLPITQNSQRGVQLLRDYLQSVFIQHIPVISFCDFIRHFSRFAIDTASYKFQQQFLVHRAAFNEDIGALKSMLQLYPESINQLDNEGHSPLSAAILAEKLFSVRMLLQSGANVNEGAANLYGSPLNIATLKGLQVVMKDLLQRGAEVSRQDLDGNTALHYVMSVFNSRGVQNSCQIVSILLEHGADANAKNKEGWTPLHLAVRKGQIDAVLFVVDYNKNNSKQHLSSSISNEKSVSSLQTRHRNNQRQLFNLNCKGSQQLLTPLHVAVLLNQLSIVEILIDEPSVNYLARNHQNQAARQLASKDLLMSKKMLLEEKRALRNIVANTDTLKFSYRLSEVFPAPPLSNEKNRDKPAIRIMNFEQKFALNTRNAEVEDAHAQTARELLTSPKETKFLQFSVSRNLVGQQVPEKHLEDDDDCDANFDALQGYSQNDEVETEHEELMFLQSQNVAAAKRFFNQTSLHKLDKEAAEDAQMINCINPSQIARVCHTRKELYTSNTIPSKFSEIHHYSSSGRIRQDKQGMLLRSSVDSYAMTNSLNIYQQPLQDSQATMTQSQRRRMNGLRSSQNQPLDSRIIQYRVETQQGEPSALHIPKLCSQLEKDQAQHFFQRLKNIVECHSSSIDGTVQQLLSHVTPTSDKFRCYARILKSCAEIDLSMQEICQLLQYSHLTLSQACKELLRKGSSLTAEAASKIIQQLNQPETFDYAQLMRESEEMCTGDEFDSGYQQYSHHQQHNQYNNFTEQDDDFPTQKKDQEQRLLTQSSKQQQFLKSDPQQTLKEFAFATLGRRALTLFRQNISYQEDSKQERALLRQFCAREARQAATPPAKQEQTNASQQNYSLLIAYEAMQASHTASVGEQSWSEPRFESASIRSGANRPIKPLFSIGQYSTVYDAKKKVQDVNGRRVSNSSQAIVPTAQQTTMPSEYFLTQGKFITDSGVTLHTDDDAVVVSATPAAHKPHSLTAREVVHKNNINSKFWHMKNEHDFQKELKIRQNTPEILINKGEPLLESPQFLEDEDADLDFSAETPITQKCSFKIVNDSNIKSAQIKNRK